MTLRNNFLLVLLVVSSYVCAQNVGIGTITPLAKLHIEELTPGNPALRIVDGNQALGKVLVSDADGNATWESPPAAGTQLKDADGDTRIDLEETADNDEHRLYANGGLVLKVYQSAFSMPMVEPMSPAGTYNSFFGEEAGLNTRLGIRNSFFGFEAGKTNTTGMENTFMGTSSGLKNGLGSENTFVGALTGNNNTNGNSNSFIGAKSGFNNTTGIENNFVGIGSGFSNVSGDFNVALGALSLYSSEDRSYNVAVGSYALYFNGTNTVVPIHATKNTALGGEAGYNNTNGYSNSFLGYQSGFKNTTGSRNTFLGSESGHENSSGFYNTFVGYFSGYANVSGDNNTFLGRESGAGNITGDNNTFLGGASGLENEAGENNTFIGASAGRENVSGKNNHFIGSDAGRNNTTASSNIAIGKRALFLNTIRRGNVAIGDSSLYTISSGNSINGGANHNTAVGYRSGRRTTVGDQNSYFGAFAGELNEEGRNNSYFGFEAGARTFRGERNAYFGGLAGKGCADCNRNTALGFGAGRDVTGNDDNTFIGYLAGIQLSGAQNVAIGSISGVSSILPQNYDNTISLGFGARVTDSNQARIGNSSITSIGGYAGWSVLSDGRYKHAVVENSPGLDFILGLRPVTYTVDYEKLARMEYNDEEVISNEVLTRARERSGERKSGFIAQEVEALILKKGVAFDGVVVPQNKYDRYALSYSSFVVPLVKAVQEQQLEIVNLVEENTTLTYKNNDLEQRLQKVEQQLLLLINVKNTENEN